MNVRKMLEENVVLRLWPETGTVLGLKRGSTYAAKRRGEIETISFGKMERVSVAAQKPEIDNGESDCRLPVEAFGGGQEAIGGSAPQSRWTTGEIA